MSGTSPISSFIFHRWRQVVLTAIVVLSSLTYFVFWAANTNSLASERAVIIPRGASFKTVLDSLQSSGVIRFRWTLDVAGRTLRLTKTMKAGKYLFPRGLSNVAILNDLAEGKSRVLVQVLIPEGWRMERIALQCGKLLGIDSQRFIALCDRSEFRRELGIDAPSLEGYLMPDTYKFLWQTTEEEIIERMVEEFRSFYVDSLRKRQEESKLTMPQVLTLASIVEGEAHLDRERPIIAGVYLNRLKKRMRLEADPTVQFVIPNGPRRLLFSDLRYDSPYNTYLYYGLPPGPINSPGRKSILAVLYPEKHSFLYFVADGSGGHVFTKNYIEHQKAVKGYRHMRREAMRDQNPPS
ncbi:MAG: endolytic transglycosylase MltG [Ignavibacteriales bacterium]|nr:endolytic transglycosylase MltG [Ignavibacteriales bacterium]